MKNPRLSNHAINRYIERTGTKRSRQRAITRLLILVEGARYMEKGYWYNQGWLIVVKGCTVVSVMRPQKKFALDMITRHVRDQGL